MSECCDKISVKNLEDIVHEAGEEQVLRSSGSGPSSPRTPTAFRTPVGAVLRDASAIAPTRRVHPGGMCNSGLMAKEGRPSREEMLAFGGLPDSEARSSARLRAQPNADIPLLERAVELACKRNLEIPKGTPNKHLSILSFSDAEIKNRADRLGISLGKNKGQIDSSISVIRSVEKERSVILLTNNLPTDDHDSSLVMRRASNLCDDLDNELDTNEGNADLLMPKKSVKRGRKYNAGTQRSVRRSARIKRLKKK